jgi:serine/threonine protein kinase/ABC-type branched-subunit amino acid transport system substrate-binding protein
MGEVWKALDTQLQRYVAIKLLHADLQNDSSFTARFQREAQLIASLHHPNIVQLYDFQVSQPSEAENAICYMVMNYVEGQTLAQYIRSTSRIGRYPSAAEIVQLFASISLAVDYAHHKGMIHRDIKPSNILLDRGNTARNPMGEPILTDFGIAKLLGVPNVTLIGSWLGTPSYTSPEQARGNPANECSDVYSLGVILYEICTGLLPFQGENAAAILMQHINAVPTLPHYINPKVPSALTMVIMRSLAKNPTDRFPTASAMAVALAEALNSPIPEVLRSTRVSLHASGEPNSQGPTPLLEVPPVAPSLESGLGSKRAGHLSDSAPVMYSSRNPLNVSLPTTPIPDVTNYVAVQGYVRGENLEERLSRLNQPLEERDVLIYASQVLDTLEDMAQQTPPLIHGNIRPANILIGNKDRRAHLVGGFNAAQLKQIPVITPGYAPLELIQGNGDPRSDIYALAATMHHLLTNRNPCNQPPFLYPLTRMLNPHVSLEMERLLACALTNDISQRYQSAMEMKQDIDDLLLRHYGIAGDTGRYASGMSGSMGGVRVTGGQQAIRPVDTATHQPMGLPTAPPLLPPQPQPVQKDKRRMWMAIVLVAALLLLILGGLLYAPLAFRRNQSSPTATSTPGIPVLSGIGVTRAPDGEYIGISDGTFAFDTKRTDGNIKIQAAAQLKAKDLGSADSLWQQAVTGDTSDAEALIYMEDRRILDAGDPYITIVVGTTLTGDANSIAVGREATQAAYVAQREYNTASKLPNGVKVRLLIANSGGVSTYTTAVAQQIVRLAQTDKTIVAVMGWTSTATTLNAIGVLSPAKIPMVANSGADVLTGRSHYFFRVVLPASSQGLVGALYAEQTLHARTAVVFVDIKNNFALGLANGFTKRFTGDGKTVLATESYTVGKSAVLPTLLQQALSKHPDVIYFAGYPADAGVVLAHLQLSDPPLLGGSSLYQLGGYPAAARAGLSHLRFTAYSYPDEWEVLGLTAKKPPFFADYKLAFDPSGQHVGSPYGYTRPDGTTMELYDAISVLLYGCSIALAGKSTIVGSDLQQALTEITGNKALQGITSQMSLGADSNPIDRAIVIICVYQGGFFKMDGVYGKFLIGEADRAQFYTPSACS